MNQAEIKQAEEIAKRCGMNVINLPRLYYAVEMATRYYHNLLVSLKDNAAMRYLEGRGVSSAIISTFRLGYAPKARGVLRSYLLKKGFTNDELLFAGLITESGGRDKFHHKTMRDRFHHRLIFPIANNDGRIVGFGARALDNSELKYFNSPQSAIFYKSHLLYGLYQAKDIIKRSGQVIIVEGYMDVLTAHQYGFRNTVGIMGIAISKYHFSLLKSLANKIIMAFDGDAGGKTALLEFAKKYLGGDYDEKSIGQMAEKTED